MFYPFKMFENFASEPLITAMFAFSGRVWFIGALICKYSNIDKGGHWGIVPPPLSEDKKTCPFFTLGLCPS